PPRPPRDAVRREPLEHQVAGIGPGDLEDVELRIELGADRTERRDRAVEQQEARREMEVHRVDELKALADHLDRVDLVQARAVVAVVELPDLGEELALALLRIADAEVGEALRKLLDVFV